MEAKYYDYHLRKARRRFGDAVLELITVLPRAIFVSNGNNVVACNFARFAANDDVKGPTSCD